MALCVRVHEHPHVDPHDDGRAFEAANGSGREGGSAGLRGVSGASKKRHVRKNTEPAWSPRQLCIFHCKCLPNDWSQRHSSPCVQKGTKKGIWVLGTRATMQPRDHHVDATPRTEEGMRCKGAEASATSNMSGGVLSPSSSAVHLAISEDAFGEAVKKVASPSPEGVRAGDSTRPMNGGASKAIPGDVDPLAFTCKFAGGLRADLRRRAPWYLSDWVECFSPDSRGQALASCIFLFFACLSPAVTFGMLFDEYTEGQLGVVEMILSSAISGIVYAIFAGQPLCILGATGPELAYTVVFFNICKQLDLEFLPARVWQGFWTALFTILLALFDLSALMNHVTRFTEEIFSALISLIFIIEAFLNIVALYTADDAATEGGRARAFLGTLLCLGTYGLATFCKGLKGAKSTVLTKTLRTLLANYGVIISIVAFSAFNYAFRDIESAVLQVPSEIVPTYNDSVTGKPRDWFVNPMGTHRPFPAWAIFFTMLPALGLTVLGYMDQNLTSLLINRKDHNLRKPPGYHLDLFVCGAVVYPVCALLGLPFTHAATVRSMTHLISLSTREVVQLEGGGTTSVVSKVIESRTTNLVIHVILLLSLAIAPVLVLVPRACLFGVFLFMGVGSMAGNQLFDRLFLWAVWDRSRYPAYDYVKNVSPTALHTFTLLQFGLLVLIYVLTRLPDVSVAFPFLIGALVFVRKGMRCCFTADQLHYLDS